MASRVRLSVPEAAEPERLPPPLSSDLLEEILLRVASPADLARAYAACVTFRSLIADHTFRSRYRSVHPPLLLGFVTSSGFHPVEESHPSAAVARAVARAADFAFDYLPRVKREWHLWRICDARNGRVLIGFRSACWNLAVCDPLSGRHLLLPPITDDLLASVQLQKQDLFHPMAKFIPSRRPSGGIEDDTSFSVILWMQSNTRFGAFVFSSVSGRWSVSFSTNHNVVGTNVGVLFSGQCVYDCFYWKAYHMSILMKLDMNTMQFCTVDLPPGHAERRVVIVESGTSNVGMFSLSCEGASVDYYTFSQNGGENSHEWQLMSTIPLPAGYYINYKCFRGPAEGYIFLEGIPMEHDAKYSVCFSLEIKSFKIERVSTRSFVSIGHPYFGFPPSMSPIRIQGYEEVKHTQECTHDLLAVSSSSGTRFPS